MAKTRTRSEVVPLVIRGQKVLLDTQLAQLYGVPTQTLNQAVKQNIRRFPEDFAFELTAKEVKSLGLRCRTSKPLAFTACGVTQVAFVLKAPRAVDMSRHVIHEICKGKAFFGEQRNM